MASADQKEFLNSLLSFLPKECVLTSDEQLSPYECDSLLIEKQKPLAVLLPTTIDQISKIMQTCKSFKIAVVARGSGTGLSGGALPVAGGVLLSLSKFNKILNVDSQNKTAIVQPGVRNIEISQAVAKYNLFYAPDPSSQIICSIGGNVSENSGGLHCLKYGLTVHNVLKVKLVDINGDIFYVGADALDTPGLDLLSIINGSEGMLAIVVEIIVKLTPKPQSIKTFLVSFDKVATAADTVAKIISEGITPSGLEMMDNKSICASEDFVKSGYPTDAAAILICELDGTNEQVNYDSTKLVEILNQMGATKIIQAKDEKQTKQFWLGRKSALPAVGRLSPDYFCMDGTIPRNKISYVLDSIEKLSKKYSLEVANVFHAGDGNLHPLILFDAKKGQTQQAIELGGKILQLCIEVGGTITGEHGVGIEKLNQMCVQFNNDELSQMHLVKKAFDSDGLLNPGKAVPTLNRCAEFGFIHIKDGKLPFAEIERF